LLDNPDAFDPEPVTNPRLPFLLTIITPPLLLSLQRNNPDNELLLKKKEME